MKLWRPDELRVFYKWFSFNCFQTFRQRLNIVNNMAKKKNYLRCGILFKEYPFLHLLPLGVHAILYSWVLYPFLPRFEKWGYTVLPLSVRPQVHPSVRQSVRPMNIFVAFFSGTTMPGFLKFGFRVYISQPYRVMHFQIHHSTTVVLNILSSL